MTRYRIRLRIAFAVVVVVSVGCIVWQMHSPWGASGPAIVWALAYMGVRIWLLVGE